MHETSRNVAKKKESLELRARPCCTTPSRDIVNVSYDMNIIMVGSLVTMYCELCFMIFKVKPRSLVEAALKFHWFHSRGVFSH